MTISSAVLPARLYTADQVRSLDRIAIEAFNIPGKTLMERAGSDAYALLKSTWPDIKNITVLCGAGNNGGDGYVIARLAHEEGLTVNLIQFGDHENLTGDAKAAAEAFFKTGLEAGSFNDTTFSGSEVLVDALLGTGLDREVGGELKACIEHVNATGLPVLAVDIPSGLHADTGRIMGTAIQADVTVTFIGLKQGLFTHEGRHCAGRIHFSDLQVPEAIYDQVKPVAQRVDYDRYISVLGRRDPSSHKGHFGHVLIVGGDSGYSGAIRMAGEAAARTGAGLVSLATRAQHAATISTGRPELMSHGTETAEDLLPLIDKASVIALGPGLGQSTWARFMLGKVLEYQKPLVVDADALNLLAQEPVYRSNWVLTPHPGEAARLLQCTSTEIQQNRPAAVQALKKKFGGVIVLKGSGTLITGNDEDYVICSDGNPGMATGGMGDVLTGTIAGLIAQHVALPEAAAMGVCLHARSADCAAQDGEIGLLASDLLPWIRKIINQV